MDSITAYCVGLLGMYVLQDACASIAFYPNEKWRWNHIARLIRAVIGLTLIILAGVNI